MPEMIFKLEDRQVEEARKWVNEHPCTLRDAKRMGAIGGKTTYTFTNTTIGEIAGIQCACGESYCLTKMEDI